MRTPALYARKLHLARPVYRIWCTKTCLPTAWAVFSRGITTPQLNCLHNDPTHHQGIQGLALLRLPARCRVLADGWELTADDASAAFHTQSIFTYHIIDLPDAFSNMMSTTGSASITAGGL